MLAGLRSARSGSAQPAHPVAPSGSPTSGTAAPTMAGSTSIVPVVAGNGVAPLAPVPSFGWSPNTPGFTALAVGAEPMNRLDGLVWALQASCEAGDAVDQRQCRKVRDSRQRSLAGQLLLVEGEAGAFTTGVWEPKTRSVTWQLVGCIRCDGIEIEGVRYQIFAGLARVTMAPGLTPPKVTPPVPTRRKIPKAPLPPVAVVEPIAVEPPLVGASARVFRDQAAAQRWIHKVANARVQFLVRVPEPASWHYGSRQGLALELVSYRAWNPCDGVVLMASDTVTKAPIDETACKPDTASELDPAPTARPLAEISRVMSTAVIAAQQCRRSPTQVGTAKLRVRIEGDGTVAALRQTGDFVGSPLAACIEKSVRALRFPTGRLPTTIAYPITLR